MSIRELPSGRVHARIMVDEGNTAELVAFWIDDTPETVRKVYAHMLEASLDPPQRLPTGRSRACRRRRTPLGE